MHSRIQHYQSWTALSLAFLVLAFSSAEIRAQGDSSCSREGSSRSAQTTQAAKFILTNQTNETLTVYWLDFEGKRQKWFDLSAGQAFEQSTFVGHLWLVTKPNGQCLAIFSAPGNFVIGKPPSPVNINRPTQSQKRTTALPKTSGSSAEAFFAEGKKYLDAKDYAKAIEAFKKVIAMRPPEKTLGSAYNYLGFAYIEAGQYDNAVLAKQEAFRLLPNHPDVAFGLGWAYYHAKQYQKALTTFTEAIRLQPGGDAETYYWMGEVYRVGLKQPEKAISAYRESLRLRPNDARTINQIGLARVELMEYPEALAAFKEAIRIKPSDGLYRQNLGGTYLGMGRKEDALQVYQELQKLDQVKAKALHKDIEAWFGIESNNEKEDVVGTYLTLGLMQREKSNDDGALRYFRRVIVLNYDAESVARAHLEMGNVHKAQQKNEKAAADYRQAVAFFQQTLRAEPTNAYAQYCLGITYLALGRKQEAQQVYSRLQRLDRQKAQELHAEIKKSK